VDVKRPVAVVGVGQTQRRVGDLSIPGWCARQSIARSRRRARAPDIDAVVIGKAPDMLEGVAMPEQFLFGAVGAHMKRLLRVHTAGSDGASTAITLMVTLPLRRGVLT
jgi:acetyl-CoA C-acetyltransferase